MPPYALAHTRYARVNAGGALVGARVVAACLPIRVQARGRANTTLFTMLSTGPFAPFWCRPFNGPTARFSVWPIRWPRRALLGAFTGLKRALLGLCWARAMLGKLGAGFRCLFSLYIHTVLDGYTVPRVGLSVWLSVWHSLS